MQALERSALDRFFNKTQPADDGSGCILWMACKQPNGYGKLGVAYRTVLAHRWIYEQHIGVALDPMELVLHSCDTRNCVNVEHLRVGTHKDNAADMDSRGRRVTSSLKGEHCSSAKLTEAQVVEIRAKYAAGNTRLEDLAIEYGMGRATIGYVVTRKTWAHVA